MRDSHRLKDKIELRLDDRQVASLVIGSLVVLGIVFVLGVMVGKQMALQAVPRGSANPLAALDAAATTDAGAVQLTFQKELVQPVAPELRAAPVKAPEPRPAEKPEPQKPEAAKPDAVKPVEKPAEKAEAPKAAEKVTEEPRVEPKPEPVRPTVEVALAEAPKPAELPKPAHVEQAVVAPAPKPQPVEPPKPVVVAHAELPKPAEKPKPAEVKPPEPKPAEKKAEEKKAEEKKAEPAKGGLDPKLADAFAQAKAKKAETPPAPPTTGFTVQISASQQKNEADGVLSKLRGAGLHPYLVEADIPGKGRWYRVRVGRFEHREEAEKYARDLKRETGQTGFATPVK